VCHIATVKHEHI